jgi:hypothetical protein
LQSRKHWEREGASANSPEPLARLRVVSSAVADIAGGEGLTDAHNKGTRGHQITRGMDREKEEIKRASQQGGRSWSQTGGGVR